MKRIWPWPPLRRGDIAAVVVVVVVLVLFAFANLKPLVTNWGFGPDWECSRLGQGNPVCVKRPPTSPAAPAH